MYASDNQGNFLTCTRHALAKAIGQLLDKIFAHNVEFLQEMITVMLLQVLGVTKPRWPTDFNNVTLEVLEMKSMDMWLLELVDIKTVSKTAMLNDFR